MPDKQSENGKAAPSIKMVNTVVGSTLFALFGCHGSTALAASGWIDWPDTTPDDWVPQDIRPWAEYAEVIIPQKCQSAILDLCIPAVCVWMSCTHSYPAPSSGAQEPLETKIWA